MKFNINKFSSGGGFVNYTPMLINSGAPTRPITSAEDSPKQESGSLMDDDLYKKLVGEGLVSDVNQFVKKLLQIESAPLAYLETNTRSRILQLVDKVNEIIINKKSWDVALTTAKEKGSLNEVAVGSYGEVFVQNKAGQIESIGVNELESKRGKYDKVLTVSELLNARQYNPTLAFEKEKVLDAARNSVGLSTITSHIKEVISQMGEYSRTEEKHMTRDQVIGKLRDSYGSAPNQQAKEGLELLYKLIETPGSQYKIEETLKTKSPGIQSAMSYIWETLGQNAQNKLKATAALNGTSPSKIIYNMMAAAIQPSTSLKISPEDNIEEKAALERRKIAEEAPKNTSTMGPLQLFASGSFGFKDTFNWNDPSIGLNLAIPITAKSTLFSGNEPLGMSTLAKINNSQIGRITNLEGVTFNGKAIKQYDLNKIIYSGNDMAARAFLPVGEDGNPDFDVLESWSEAEKVIQNHPEWTNVEINNFYQDQNLGFIRVDRNKGLIQSERLKPFIIFNVFTSDDADLDFSKAKRLSRSEEKDVKRLIDPYLESVKLEKMPSTFSSKFYKGIVAYPLLNEAPAIAASIENNLYAQKSDMITAMKNLELLHGKNVPQGSAQALKSQNGN